METKRNPALEGYDEEIIEELDFHCGNIELCNTVLLPVFKKHGIDPKGGWVNLEALDKETVDDIYHVIFD